VPSRSERTESGRLSRQAHLDLLDEPRKIWLATFTDVKPGQTFGINGDVNAAVEALQEHSFREAYDPEKYHAECEAERLRLLFCLPDRSGERFP
jgi:hypothetical protein